MTQSQEGAVTGKDLGKRGGNGNATAKRRLASSGAARGGVNLKRNANATGGAAGAVRSSQRNGANPKSAKSAQAKGGRSKQKYEQAVEDEDGNASRTVVDLDASHVTNLSYFGDVPDGDGDVDESNLNNDSAAVADAEKKFKYKNDATTDSAAEDLLLADAHRLTLRGGGGGAYPAKNPDGEKDDGKNRSRAPHGRLRHGARLHVGAKVTSAHERRHQASVEAVQASRELREVRAKLGENRNIFFEKKKSG